MAALPNFHEFDAASSAPDVAAEGFVIRLPSAQLGDLIQINCLNRVRGAFQVSSEGREGHLFFEGGQLIHADFGAVKGLDAVVQMLGWRGGAIEPCEAPWPTESTIDMGADALLLCAAQRLDEMPLRPSGLAPDLTTKVVRRVAIAEEAGAAGEPEIELQSSVIPAHAQLRQLQVAQLTFDGVVRQLKSGATLDLADTGFFSQRMAAAIGEALGVGDCHAVFLDGSAEAVVVIKGRSVVATRGDRADLNFILARLGLA